MNTVPWRVTRIPPLNLDDLPVAFTLPPAEIGGKRLQFELALNDYHEDFEVQSGELVKTEGGFFTLTTWRQPADDEDNMLWRQKLVFMSDVFRGAQHIDDILGLHIVPIDMTLRETEITKDNLFKRVHLYFAFDPLERPVS